MLSLANAQSLVAGIVAAALSTLCLTSVFSSKSQDEAPGLIKSFFLFFYSSFIKPHQGGTKGNQQDALESFYKKQAGAYDATRKVLLRGREDMLALVAAQLQAKLKETNSKYSNKNKRIWVDVSVIGVQITQEMTNVRSYRLAAALALTSKPWAHLSMSQPSSRAYTLSTSPLLFVKWLESDSNALAGRMSRLFARMLASFVWRITSRGCPRSQSHLDLQP